MQKKTETKIKMVSKSIHQGFVGWFLVPKTPFSFFSMVLIALVVLSL